jgi:hypothetical protein
MRNRNTFDPGFPLFMKVWFAFIAFLAISMLASVAYFASQIVSAGPEGIGHAIGSIVKGIDQGRKD